MGVHRDRVKRGGRYTGKLDPRLASRVKKGVTTPEHRMWRAKEILAAWETSRQPFMLYLRSFRVTLYHGPDQRMLLENHFWATLSLHGIGVLTVVDQNEVPLPGSLGHGAPAPVVPNEQWQSVVSDLIGKAEIIVSEIPVLSPGAAFELNACLERGKVAQTAVIVPSPDGPFHVLDDEPIVSRFPRVICHDELPELGAKDHFVFRDLVDRARAIAELEPSARIALVDTGKLLTRFPVAFAGLDRHYELLAAGYETAGQPHRAVRSYFRALVAASANSDDAAIAAISEKMARLLLVMGDRPKALNYLKGGIDYSRRTGDEQRSRRLEQLLQDIERTQ